MKYLILVVAFITISSCSKKASSQSSNTNYKDVAYEALDAPQVNFQENETKEYVLATFQENGGVPGPQSLKYVIIKIADNSIVNKESVPQGSVKWSNDYQVEITAPPGIIKDSNETVADYTYLLDVRTGKKIKKPKVKY